MKYIKTNFIPPGFQKRLKIGTIAHPTREFSKGGISKASNANLLKKGIYLAMKLRLLHPARAGRCWMVEDLESKVTFTIHKDYLEAI